MDPMNSVKMCLLCRACSSCMCEECPAYGVRLFSLRVMFNSRIPINNYCTLARFSLGTLYFTHFHTHYTSYTLCRYNRSLLRLSRTLFRLCHAVSSCGFRLHRRVPPYSVVVLGCVFPHPAFPCRLLYCQCIWRLVHSSFSHPHVVPFVLVV